MYRIRRSFVSLLALVFVLSFIGIFPGSPGVSPAEAAEGHAPRIDSVEPFAKGRVHTGVGLGTGLGLKILGSELTHDIVFGWAGIGKILTDTLAEGKWYAGNLEIRGELFGGLQYEPKSDIFTGVTGFFRYNLATGRRIVPFGEAGGGFSYTDIGGPDLGGDFQFNLRGGIGMHYFVARDRSIEVQSQFFHLSNGGLKETNHGLNAINFIIGYNWFF